MSQRNDGSDVSSTVARAWADMHERHAMEWEDKGMCDEVYYVKVHVPCGTKVNNLMGHVPICPKCQPEEWAERRKRDAK